MFRKKNKGKIKVLLVDDEEEFAETLSERLQMRDIESSTVFDGKQAMERVSQEEPDVLVLDLKMPGMHGIEVLEWMKRNHPSVQVIILTGHGSESDEERARELGAFDYMKKPARTDSLVSRIKDAYTVHVENAMSSIAFAESGEFDTAVDILRGDREKDAENDKPS